MMIGLTILNILKDNWFDMLKVKWLVWEERNLTNVWRNLISAHFMKRRVLIHTFQVTMKTKFKCCQKIWEILLFSQQEIQGLTCVKVDQLLRIKNYPDLILSLNITLLFLIILQSHSMHLIWTVLSKNI